MEYDLNQTSTNRAWQDFERFRKSAKSFWGFEVAGAAIFLLAGAFVGFWLIPDNSTQFLQFAYPAIGGAVGFILGFIVAFGIIYLVMLMRAPYKQRNEARLIIEKLSQTPLVVECNSYEKRLVGETWLKEKQYLWLLNVILTNQSDTHNVSTKAISLELNFPVADGDVKRYALPLVPDRDRDKYGHPSMASGRPLAENEYLRPHESLRGFYQFLDEDTPWKPNSIKTWPTLVVVDSFNAPHRREFPRPRFATQSNSDKEGSQP
jgi:hypothetical protein